MDNGNGSEDDEEEDSALLQVPAASISNNNHHHQYGAGYAAEDYERRRRSSITYSKLEQHPTLTFILILSLGWLLGLFYVWPFPTTVHAIIPLAIALIAWTAIQWASLIQLLLFHRTRLSPWSPTSSPTFSLIPPKWSRYRRIALLLSTILTCTICLNAIPQREQSIPLPALIPSNTSIPERYFVAANLYNNEDVIPEWTDQLLKLCDHGGSEDTRHPSFDCRR